MTGIPALPTLPPWTVAYVSAVPGVISSQSYGWLGVTHVDVGVWLLEYSEEIDTRQIMPLPSATGGPDSLIVVFFTETPPDVPSARFVCLTISGATFLPADGLDFAMMLLRYAQGPQS